jgi:hypothetical protein
MDVTIGVVVNDGGYERAFRGLDDERVTQDLSTVVLARASTRNFLEHDEQGLARGNGVLARGRVVGSPRYGTVFDRRLATSCTQHE